jgi:hypothetical protein
MTCAQHNAEWDILPAKMKRGPLRDKAKEEWSKALKVNFPDLNVYVQKN